MKVMTQMLMDGGLLRNRREARFHFLGGRVSYPFGKWPGRQAGATGAGPTRNGHHAITVAAPAGYFFVRFVVFLGMQVPVLTLPWPPWAMLNSFAVNARIVCRRNARLFRSVSIRLS
jgi:hypothetical protein